MINLILSVLLFSTPAHAGCGDYSRLADSGPWCQPAKPDTNDYHQPSYDEFFTSLIALNLYASPVKLIHPVITNRYEGLSYSEEFICGAYWSITQDSSVDLIDQCRASADECLEVFEDLVSKCEG